MLFLLGMVAGYGLGLQQAALPFRSLALAGSGITAAGVVLMLLYTIPGS